MSLPHSQLIASLMEMQRGVFEFIGGSTYAKKKDDPSIADFAFGNPHEMPLEEFSEALARHSVPQNKDWFAYKLSEPQSQEVVAKKLTEIRGLPFEPADIAMTSGAFGALAVVLKTIVDPGDEVLFISPPWFFYEAMIVSVGGRAVRVKMDAETFDLDVDAIAAAITPKTRGIIVNSPNNPTGKIYPPETLTKLAELLTERSESNGRTIYLLSDEAYSRIVFDGRPYHSPVTYYPNTFLLYTYAKTLLTPGQRLGYIALPPTMPDRHVLRIAVMMSQVVGGWMFPNALLQHALADIEELSVDIGHIQKKRDRMVTALREMGYEVHSPEGTFYLLPRSPIADDVAFTEMLADENVFVLPGTVVEMPGWFRISLTANDRMIEQGLGGFERALDRAAAKAPA
jgi:aspartate aminotransferase